MATHGLLLDDKPLKMKGAASNVSDFPLPVGEQNTRIAHLSQQCSFQLLAFGLVSTHCIQAFQELLSLLQSPFLVFVSEIKHMLLKKIYTQCFNFISTNTKQIQYLNISTHTGQTISVNLPNTHKVLLICRIMLN